MSLDGTVTDLDNEIKLKQLYNTRKHLKASLTRFNTFLNSFSDDKLLQLKKRIEDIEVVYKKFNETQLAIELINEDEENSDERDIFENRYYDILQSALDTVERISLQNQPPASAHSVIQGTNLNQNALDYQPNKFPTIELIKFYGEYDKWPQFRDLYISMIHDDPKIQKVRKFYYLVGSLRGQAEKILSGIPITNENYDVAWNLLKDRFENVALTLKNHVKALFNLPNVSDKYSLRNLKDDFQFRFRAIEALGEPVDSWDTLLIHILTSKLDTSTEERWDEKLISNKIGKPTLENLLDFLADRCSILETKTTQSLNSEKASKNYNAYKTGSKNIPGRSKTQNFSVNEIKCVMCNNSHYIYRCQKFKELAVADRWVEAKRLKLCTNCLRTNHQSPDCTAQGCKVCSKQHNTLLHIDGHNTGENQSVACSSRVHLNKPNEILLSTAIILIKGRDGTWHRCRVLLDSGAQANFITSDLLHKLNLAPTHVKMQSVGVGGAAISISNQIKTEISSVSKTFSATLAFFVLKRITPRIPNCTFTQKLLNLPTNLELADAEFNVSSEIDLLIGAELFYDLLECEQIKLGNTSPILQKTKLGWIISGPLYTDMEAPVACNLSVTGKLDEAIERFWKIEEVPQPKILSHEEQTCENHFINTTERDETGRFIVRLPISELSINFGNSVKNAIKRLHSVEHRFVRNISFKQEYVKFMSEYEALGHMTKFEYETNTANENVYYLPHHGVLNESSSTTKLRVVFDGSCKSSNNVSLNEKLLIGPTIQDDLFSILSRFRLHNYVMTADVEKMYRQVLIAPDQRNLQRIVWRDDEDKQINHYALNTITYGTASASFLAIRCLQQAGIENKAEYPNASKVILKDFYVDDLITGAATIAEAQLLASNITLVLNKYGFNLRKWVVNDSQIMNCNASADQEYYITDNSVKKALGVYWNSKTDIFKFVINEQNIKPNIVTKRTLLSAISKIFDPLGLIAPVTVRAKILMQILWQAKIGWDESPSSDIVQLWEQFSDQLIELNNVNIPRHVLLERFEFIEFHVFSDASLRAYGAAVYIKTYLNDQSNVSLLCSKTRVAPIKTITLPRLELCGALLGLQLYLKLRESLSINTSRVYFWTDSSIVLSWLRLPANTLKIFVSNRVSMIQQNTSIDQWRYVPSLKNPADILSRGTNPAELRENELWWSGPSWLLQPLVDWPKLPNLTKELPDKRNTKISLVCRTIENEIFKRYSSLYKLQRITALMFWFSKNCRLPRGERVTEISISDIDEAMHRLLKLSQFDSFQAELQCLNNNKPISAKSKLLPLAPILGPDELLRVGGRLSKCKLPYNQKHQIILCPSHLLTKLLIEAEHKRQLHVGAQGLLNSMRQSFWILRGRQAIRSVLRKCLICFKVNPTRLIQKMAVLPEDRVSQNRPFFVSGVDFAGPFYIRDGKLRNRKIIKAYLCIFICFCTKAVHLECVSDLSTESFLNALKRFTSRRGLCKILYSDNGTNLVGANNELKAIFDFLSTHIQDANIQNFLNQNKIRWKFIPPRSPHHGGLWESAVRLAKFHIVRIIGNTHLTFEELSTVFCLIEAVLNSRPLTPISGDPDDLQALTPGHFLIGDSLTSIPSSDLTHLPKNRLTQYQLLQKFFQQFWHRWSSEYLSTLQQRSKWHEPTNSAQEGSLVLLVDDQLPPLLWRMSRIISIRKNSDGLPRICTVKTSPGICDRAVQKLCLLPIESSIPRMEDVKAGGMSSSTELEEDVATPQ